MKTLVFYACHFSDFIPIILSTYHIYLYEIKEHGR